MADFDAESYLRLAGERLLLGSADERGQPGSALEGPAEALVAVGAIDAERAQRLFDDHTVALAVRGNAGFAHFGARRRHGGRAPRLPPRRTLVLGAEIPFAAGRLELRELTIRPRQSTLGFRWRSDDSRPRSGHRFGGGLPWGAGVPAISDDAGHRLTVGPGSGGGSGGEWEGVLTLDGPLSAATEWLEVEGTRISVDRRLALSEVRVEPLPDEPAVSRYLWRRLAVGETPFGGVGDIEPIVDALVAAGALDPEGPLLRDVRAVARQMPEHPRHPGGASRGSARGLPEPWRSLLRRRAGQRDRPAQTVVVGALTPPFDGVQLAVETLAADAEGFAIEFEVAPDVLRGGPLGRLPVAWWARDEHGNHHLGSPAGWSGGGDHASGTLRFWPALARDATRVELLPSADTERAVVSISLTETAEPAS